MRTEGLRGDLAAARQYLLAVIARVPDAESERPVSSAGWTIRQTLAHLAGAEPSMITLCQRIIAGEGGAPPDFDLQRFNARQVEKRSQMRLAELLAALEDSRRQALALLAGLSPTDLQKRGRHGSGRDMSVAEIVATIGRHERDHGQEIEQALRKEG
jgi:uncharacterized protein (TIGR03083 family)